jgi:hypothetical protein
MNLERKEMDTTSHLEPWIVMIDDVHELVKLRRRGGMHWQVLLQEEAIGSARMARCLRLNRCRSASCDDIYLVPFWLVHEDWWYGSRSVPRQGHTA